LAVDSKGRLRADVVLVNGAVQTHKEGHFAVFWKEAGRNCSEPVGNDIIEARTALRRRQTRLNAQLAGVAIPEVRKTGSRVKLQDAIDDFLLEVQTHRAKKTHAAYRSMLADFSDSCPKTYLDEIERKDLMNFTADLKSDGLGDRTIYNKFELLMTFLKANKIPRLVSAKDWPRFTEQEVDIYEVEELTRLFAHCNQAERVLFRFFLGSAGREQEVAFTAWQNLDLKNGLWHMRAKPELGFKPKDYEERTVPLPDWLVEDLKTWRKRHGRSYLIFPHDSGDAEGHMLRTLKQIALKAKLNCGHCTNRKGLSCRRHPVCGRWYLHKFRATAATTWLQNDIDIRTVQTWLGHSDMESTLRYLKAASARKPIVREKVNAAFASMAR
jgi:integrase/recombinase XerD